MEISISQRRHKMINDLKQLLIKNNYKFEEITDEILLIKNYPLKEELDFIWSKINEASQADWEIEYLSNLPRFCMEKFGRDDVENLVAEGKFEITQNWADKNLNISHYEEYKPFYKRLNDMVVELDSNTHLSGFATIQRMQPGVELKSHTDQRTDPSIKYATILYLNDDYNNGELFFENFNLELKPKPGELLIFPGNEKYEHGVRHVGEGPIRYVLVGFIKEVDHYVKNKY
jgi:hypothetical protein